MLDFAPGNTRRQREDREASQKTLSSEVSSLRRVLSSNIVLSGSSSHGNTDGIGGREEISNAEHDREAENAFGGSTLRSSMLGATGTAGQLLKAAPFISFSEC